VEDVVGDEAVEWKLHDFETERVRLIGADAPLFQPEVNPTERQRDGDRKSNHAAPRHQKMAPEPATPAMRDKALKREVRDEMFQQLPAVGEHLAAKEQLERTFEIALGRRPLEPDDVAINDCECGE
jgi:hypothetical protein